MGGVNQLPYIPDVIADYGPPHSYWCFGYERLNGLLAEIPNSKVNIEPQIMNRMLLQFSYASSTLPVIPFSLEFHSHWQMFLRA